MFSVPPRKEGPLSFQNPSFAHPGRDDPELIPVNLNNHGTSESRRHLFDELENEGKCSKSVDLLLTTVIFIKYVSLSNVDKSIICKKV